jgi:ATP-dependent RNA helicase DDX52/ROK1
MEELFTILSSSARLDKSRRKPKRKRELEGEGSRFTSSSSTSSGGRIDNEDGTEDDPRGDKQPPSSSSSLMLMKRRSATTASRDRTGKRDDSEAKRQQVHHEQMAAFRRSMSIQITNKDDPFLPDAIPSFDDMEAPTWWIANNNSNSNNDYHSFVSLTRAVMRNVEAGKWKEPTPIQMQAIPTLLERRDCIGAAPTGSGKSGAFILPALLLSGAPYHVFYKSSSLDDAVHHEEKEEVDRKNLDDDNDNELGESNSNSNSNTMQSQTSNPKKNKKNRMKRNETSRQGEIRSLLLAPSRELAVQLHREVERLGHGKPGGISSLLLAKSNVAHVIAGTAGGKSGLDVMISTPLRLVDAIDKGLRLDSLRLVVLDEADRLLDAADGTTAVRRHNKNDKRGGSDDDSSGDDDDDNDKAAAIQSSGSNQTQTFLAQMDRILSCIPVTAVRALFSATVTPTVKSLAENILRDPVDVKIAAAGSMGGANTDIEQELMFVGREEGKLLAMRQLKQRGQLKAPAIVFVQSQERAQALFAELLYDGMHVDVIHAGRSRTARDDAVSKFRKGETWVLICTDLVARGVDFRAVNMVINYDLPTSGITYVHRIGRTGRAGRKGRAITLFTEADFDNLRTIANVMKQSGCQVEDWMLQLKKSTKKTPPPRRGYIDTTPRYDKQKLHKRKQIIQESKKKRMRTAKSKDE